MNELLQEAIKSQASELIVASNSAPQLRIKGSLKNSGSVSFIETDWKSLKADLLTSSEIGMLESIGRVEKTGILNGTPFETRIFQDKGNYRAVFKFKHLNWLDHSEVPQALTSGLERVQGLSWISHAQSEYIPGRAKELIEKIQERKQISVTVFQGGATPIRFNEGRCVFEVNFNQSSEEDRAITSEGSDLIVYIGLSEESILPDVIQNLEAGRAVWIFQTATSSGNCYYRLFNAVKQRLGDFGAARIAENMSMIANETVVFGPDNQPHSIFEVIPPMEKIKRAFAAGQMFELVKEIQEAPEGAGILSRNHSLLSLLLRRHIDLKKAFEVSHSPDRLDLMLKKVGI